MLFGSTYVLLEADYVMDGTAKQAKESGSASATSRRIVSLRSGALAYPHGLNRVIVTHWIMSPQN
jgi:hypothetical protein